MDIKLLNDDEAMLIVKALARLATHADSAEEMQATFALGSLIERNDVYIIPMNETSNMKDSL